MFSEHTENAFQTTLDSLNTTTSGTIEYIKKTIFYATLLYECICMLNIQRVFVFLSIFKEIPDFASVYPTVARFHYSVL
jgi:hypothetical protein